MAKRRQNILGLYFTEDERFKADFRDIMLEKYLDQADDNLNEALAMLAWRLEMAEEEGEYEECAIIKDVLQYFDYSRFSKD